ncbi:FlgK family flagellar hook-associated protein, partial [Rhodoferax sp.]|uniref:FlgK family flagellar hook-associated protein n=1 Tax=Rhodoferax sp. TaxID=50421 RepID=UPI003BB7B9C5
AGNTLELQESVISGGSLGGLLQFRNETLAPSQNALGRMAIALADTFNAQHRLGVDLNGALGADFFSQASPGVISNSKNAGNLVLTPSISSSNQLTTSDYRLDVGAGPAYTLTRLSDKQTIPLTPGFPGAAPADTTTFDGVKLTLASGAAAVGDSFLIQPTRTGARDLSVLVSDPAKVAAASPIITGNTAGNQGNGAISAGAVDKSYPASPLAATVTLTYDSGTNELSGFPVGSAVTVTLANGAAKTYGLAGDGTTYYDSTPPAPVQPATGSAGVPFTSGAAISFDGITVNISGNPADGDSFTIGNNTGGVSDGSNALLLGALQNKKTIGGGSASFNDAYGQLVSTVGNKARQIQIANTAQTSLSTQIRAFQQAVSGVNQDEETANLLMYQQMYQANAKVIQTASTMFDAVLGISR